VRNTLAQRVTAWSTLRERLADQLWVWPALFVAIAVVLAFLLSIVDDHVRQIGWLRFPGGPSSARSLLSSIAGAMITFTGLVFSITVLVLQLASQQFSPRVLRTFLRDTTSKLALGMFTATFTYALIALRQIGPDDIPSLSVTASVALVLASVAVFIAYLNHMANAIRVTTVMRRVADEGRDLIDGWDRSFDAAAAAQDAAEFGRWDARDAAQLVPAPASGVLEAVDLDRAVRFAAGADVVLLLVPAIGDFVTEGADLIRIHGAELSDGAAEEVGSLCSLSRERSVRQDVAFAFRQLVDIAERALSPSINDPTTAVQALDQIHDLLRRIAPRRFPSAVHRDDDGRIRIVMRPVTWDAILRLAVAEIRSYGRSSIQVHRRLRAMLLDLLEVAPEARRAGVRRELRALDDVVSALPDGSDRRLARTGDAQGLGG
jgi:uncharacterized membrane protein